MMQIQKGRDLSDVTTVTIHSGVLLEKVKSQIYGTIVSYTERYVGDGLVAIVINKVVWYAVSIFVNKAGQLIRIKISEHLTLEGAEEQFNKILRNPKEYVFQID